MASQLTPGIKVGLGLLAAVVVVGVAAVALADDDPKGFNSALLGTPADIQRGYATLGYNTPSAASLGPSTRSFQVDYNAVSKAFADGVLTLPQAPAVAALVRGALVVDSDPGPNTLRALEIALLVRQSGARWYPLAAEASP